MIFHTLISYWRYFTLHVIQTEAINVCLFNIFVLLSCLAWLLCFFFSQGYGGGDELNMLRRHFIGTPTKFGVGANRAAVASHFIQKYGYIDIGKSSWHEKQYLDRKVDYSFDSEKIGVVVLDDAMQVMQLSPDPTLSFSLMMYYFMIFFLTMILKTPSSAIEICSISFDLRSFSFD